MRRWFQRIFERSS